MLLIYGMARQQETDMTIRPAIIPSLRYEDARAAIDFLCKAFGFTEHAIHAHPEDNSRIMHAELLFAGQMVMLASDERTPFATAAPLKSVREAGGNTQSLYVVLEDVDGHAERARNAGASIFMQPEDQSYGGRSYSVHDPEGYAWTFGSYDPFATYTADETT